MIVNIRGTSGSGKSTLVRDIMGGFPTRCPFYVKGRRRPLGYLCTSMPNDGVRPLVVAGHYETPCGGCDTINGFDAIYDVVRKAAGAGNNVLFEGLLASAESRRLIELHEAGEEVHVIALTTPLDVCIESINARRRAKKPDAPPVNPKNTESKYKGVQSCVKKFKAAGIRVHELDRAEALALARQLLSS